MKKNIEFIVGDIVEHWEKGIGKILLIDSGSIKLNFKNKGKENFTRSQEESLKKLNPNGLLANYYENEDLIIKLASDASQDIIKLLIIDEGNNKIERNRIKSLLTESKSDTGWRKEFYIVLTSEWGKWWPKVLKKLNKDPIFDTSDKKYIFLRDLPVSIIDDLIKRYETEKSPEKKLQIAEQIIDKLDSLQGNKIIDDIREYVISILEGDQAEQKILSQALFVALKLKALKLLPEDVIKNEDSLIIDVLIEGNLPIKKSIYLYSILSEKSSQKVYNHLMIYLCGNKKIKDIVLRKLTYPAWFNKFVNRNDSDIQLNYDERNHFNYMVSKIKKNAKELETDIQLIFSRLSEPDMRRDSIRIAIFDVLFLMLISIKINKSVSDVIAHFAANNKVTYLMFKYFNNIVKLNDVNVAYVMRFLSSLDPNTAIQKLNDSLLTYDVALKNPDLFLEILAQFRESHELFKISMYEVGKIILHAYEIVASGNDEKLIELKLKVAALMESSAHGTVQTSSYSNEELSNIVINKLLPIEQRKVALNLLKKRDNKNVFKDIAITLVKKISNNDFDILRDTIEYIADNQFTENIIIEIIKENVLDSEILKQMFLEWVDSTGKYDRLISAMLRIGEKYPNILANLDRIEFMLNNDKMIRSIFKYALQMVNNKTKDKVQIINIFSALYPNIFKECLEESSTYLEQMIHKIKDDHQKQQESLELEMKYSIEDAIAKTSQRYEEYLRKLRDSLPILEELSDTLGSNFELAQHDINKKAIINNLVKLKEDITWILYKLSIS